MCVADWDNPLDVRVAEFLKQDKKKKPDQIKKFGCGQFFTSYTLMLVLQEMII